MGKDISRAKVELQRIKEKYFQTGIQSIKEINSKNEQTICFENGDYWTILLVNERCGQGRRANISYIDRFIPKEKVERIILPCTTAPPYNAYTYF